MKAKSGMFLLLFIILWTSSCSRTPEMVERLPPLCSLQPSNYNEVPVILVGVITESTTPVGKFRPTRYNPQLFTRLYRVRMKVENVLQGDVMPGKIVSIFFFVNSQVVGSDLPLSFALETRQMFFLQRNYGELRIITDRSRNHCAIQVFSGAHPNFQRNPSKPVIEDAKDLLLTRGEGTSDKQMAEAVYEADGCFLFDVESRIKWFQQIVKRETPPVREAACSLLKVGEQPCEQSSEKKLTNRE